MADTKQRCDGPDRRLPKVPSGLIALRAANDNRRLGGRPLAIWVVVFAVVGAAIGWWVSGRLF